MSQHSKRLSYLALLATVAASLTFVFVLMAPTADAALPGPVITGCFIDAVKNVRAGCCLADPDSDDLDVQRYEVWLCDVDSRGDLFWRLQGHRCIAELPC